MGERGQRSYAYLNSKPIEELGHMKKRIKPPGSTHANPLSADHTDCFGLRKHFSKQDFAKKVAERYEEAKGILPYGNDVQAIQKQKQRPSSIKIVKREPCTGYSGAFYLMKKSAGRGSGHPQRKHVAESHFQCRADIGRRHYPQLNDMSKTQEVQKSYDNLATKTKVSNDLMSSIPDNQYHRLDRPSFGVEKQPQKHNTMHKTSYEAGYQREHKPTISFQKQVEMVGNGLDKEPDFVKTKRDDFRKSSFVLG